MFPRIEVLQHADDVLVHAPLSHLKAASASLHHGEVQTDTMVRVPKLKIIDIVEQLLPMKGFKTICLATLEFEHLERKSYPPTLKLVARLKSGVTQPVCDSGLVRYADLLRH